jgi:hypothetical protein
LESLAGVTVVFRSFPVSVAGIVPIPPAGCSYMIIRCFCTPVGLNAAATARPRQSTGHFGGHFLLAQVFR